MQVSQNGINLIKEYEGFKSKSYLCPAGIWTIGYGTTRIGNNPVKKGMVCTREEAENWLKQDVIVFLNGIESAINSGVKLNQNQVDSLVSFVYNVGIGNFKKSTLLKYINDGFFVLAKNEFKRWNKGGGKVLPGLVARRAKESELFSSTDNLTGAVETTAGNEFFA